MGDAPADRRERGRFAEEIAARFLVAQGMQVVERNARGGGGELDIVAREGETIVFVEVRSRRCGSRFSPEASVDRAKRRRLVRAAGTWLARHGQSLSRCRFDVVAVIVSSAGFRVRHHRGAFVAGD